MSVGVASVWGCGLKEAASSSMSRAAQIMRGPPVCRNSTITMMHMMVHHITLIVGRKILAAINFVFTFLAFLP